MMQALRVCAAPAAPKVFVLSIPPKRAIQSVALVIASVCLGLPPLHTAQKQLPATKTNEGLPKTVYGVEAYLGMSRSRPPRPIA